MPDEPVFYAPSLDYYVVTRYADVEQVFLDPETYSAATAQLPLVKLEPEALKILAEGGHRPQPSMVSLDPPAHTRLRRPASRAFTPRRVKAMEERIQSTVRRAARRGRRHAAVRPRRRAHVPAAREHRVLVHGRSARGLGAAQAVVRLTRDARLGPPGARGAGRARAQHGRLPRLSAAARREQGRRPRRRLRERAARHPRRGPGGAQPRGDRLDPVLALVRRPRDDEQPDRQPRPAAAGGAHALGGDRVRPRADPRRGRRDAALRHLGAGCGGGSPRGRSRSAASTCPRARSCSCGSPRPGATATSSRTRTRSTPRARTPTTTSRSARASTTARAPASASSRRGSRSRG